MQVAEATRWFEDNYLNTEFSTERQGFHPVQINLYPVPSFDDISLIYANILNF